MFMPIMCVDIFLMFVLLYIAQRVIRLTKCKNIRISLLMVFMNLTMFANLIVKIYYVDLFSNLIDNPDFKWDQTLQHILLEIPPIMMYLTVMINLNQWAFYFIKIREHTYRMKQVQRDHRLEKKKIKVMNALTICIAFVILTFEIYSLIDFTYESNKSQEDVDDEL